MLRLRYIMASLALLTSGIVLFSNINIVTCSTNEQKKDDKKEDDQILENTFFTLNRVTASIYCQKLAEDIATEYYGPGVKVVLE